MKIDFNKKYTTIAVYAIIVFLVCLLLVVAAFKFESFKSVFVTVFGVLSPIIWGLVIAYLLNPIMQFFERYLKKLINKKKEHPKLLRGLSVTITTVVTLAAMSALIAIVLPQVISSLTNIFDIENLKTYFTNAEMWVSQLLQNNPEINNFVESQFEALKGYVFDFASSLEPQLKLILSNITTGAYNFLMGFKDFVLGFIVSMYLLASKETFQAQAKKILYALFSKKTCVNVLSVVHKADYTFSKFISGKTLDSFIIGMLCFIAMSIMQFENAVLISVIVGVTNMIPFFGPFIGAIPSAILVLFQQPKMVIPFIIFILILQQFDGNILGPKILGDSTGLPAFWVMFAIFIGGGLFGFVGMLICVPVFAVIYMLVRQFVENKLRRKGLPEDTLSYKRGKRPHNVSGGVKTVVLNEVFEVEEDEDFTPFFPENIEKSTDEENSESK